MRCATRRGRGSAPVPNRRRGGDYRADLFDAPVGAKRCTLVLLEQEARRRPAMQQISRETIRRLLKKTASSPGAR